MDVHFFEGTLHLMSRERARIDISPSDLGQSYVRIIFVTAVLLSSAFSAEEGFGVASAVRVQFQLAYWYLIFSIVLCAWTYLFVARGNPSLLRIRATRCLGILADTGALAAYTAFSGAYCVVLLPLCVTSIIGYGYRFGLQYLFSTLVLHFVFLTVAISYNSYFETNVSLLYAYYLSILLIPLYSASLLRKHRTLLEQLHDVNEARSRFIANMSHELRTPLHAIISVSELMEEERLKGRHASSDSQHQIETVRESAKHLLNLVNKVLDVASAVAGKRGTDKFVRINLYAAVLSALRICQPAALEKKLQFFWRIDHRIPAHICGLYSHFQDIVINTLGNATKYTSDGHVSVSVEYESTYEKPCLYLVVSDTGCGIPPRLLPTIFEPFTMGNDGAGRTYPGTGLGLTLTKQYVAEMDGAIEIHSIEGIGTRCEIRIPMAFQPVQDEVNGANAGNAQCQLIGAASLDCEEIAMFSAAGWDFRSVEVNSTELCQPSESTCLIIVDDGTVDFGEHLIVFRNSNPYSFVVQYCRDGIDAARKYPQVNFQVQRRAVSDLVSVRKFLEIAFPTDMNVSRESRPLVQQSKLVLVADDNAINRATAQLALEAIGHVVTLVSSGEAALGELDSNKYDVAIIDMHMPGISGIEVAKIYQYCAPNDPIPIVFLTADATDGARQAASDAGAVAYLTKPLGARDIRQAVAKYARSSATRKSIEAPTEGLAPIASSVGNADSTTSEIDDLFRFGVSTKDLRRLIDEFESDAKNLLDIYETYCVSGNISSAREALHALYGAAGAVGSWQLMQAVNAVRTGGPPAGLNVSGSEKEQLTRFLLLDIKNLHEKLAILDGKLAEAFH
jgi:two-component system sensor histidine kinase RpfC